MEFGTLFFAFQSGWWKEKLRSWGYFWKWSTWEYILRRRKFVHSIRHRSDREMLQNMVGVVVSQEVESKIMMRIVNPVLAAYLALLKRLVLW